MPLILITNIDYAFTQETGPEFLYFEVTYQLLYSIFPTAFLFPHTVHIHLLCLSRINILKLKLHTFLKQNLSYFNYK